MVLVQNLNCVARHEYKQFQQHNPRIKGVSDTLIR
jgi:hypothetical protein